MAAGAAAAAAGVPLPVFAFFGSSFSGSSGSSFWETEEGRQLIVFFGQTLISWGVPAAVALVFVLLAYKPDKVRVRLARALTLALTLAPSKVARATRRAERFRPFDCSGPCA